MFAEGGCACGAVRYRLASEPMFVHACHCRDCQRLSGGPYIFNALIEKSRFEVAAGAPGSFELRGGSGTPHDVYFCSRCGTGLWSEYRGFPGPTWFVRAGTLDRPELLAPDVHIFTRSKHPSVQIPPGVPAFEAYYDLRKLWPADRLERLRVNRKSP